MTSLTVLSAKYGIPVRQLKRFCTGEALDFEDEDFEIDRYHQKAIGDLTRKKFTPYVIAYALWCKEIGPEENFVRYDNLFDIAAAKGLSLGEAIFYIRAKQIDSELLPAAKHWIDRAAGVGVDTEAMSRIAKWCKTVLAAASPFGEEHAYLAVRLLRSLPLQEMPSYPKSIQRALNRTKHNGFLDGWYRLIRDNDGPNRTLYYRPKFDL